MSNRQLRLRIRQLTFLAVFVTAFGSGNVFAQRGGAGAKGGSNRPDRTQPQPEQRTKSILRNVIGPAIATPTPSPSPSPEATPTPEAAPTEFCDKTKPGTCPGTYKLTFGISVNDHARHADAAPQKTAGGFALNVYVTRRVFVEIDNDTFVWKKPQGADAVRGFGDTVLNVGGDPLLEKEGSKRPGIWVTYAVKLPTASATKTLGTGEVDHSITGAVYKTYRKVNYFELDFNEYLSGKTGASGYDGSSGLIGVFERALSDKDLLHSEIGGTFATKSSNAEMYTLNYLEHSFTDHTIIRLGGRVGLTPNSPRVGFYAALRFKGNLKEVFK